MPSRSAALLLGVTAAIVGVVVYSKLRSQTSVGKEAERLLENLSEQMDDMERKIHSHESS